MLSTCEVGPIVVPRDGRWPPRPVVCPLFSDGESSFSELKVPARAHKKADSGHSAQAP